MPFGFGIVCIEGRILESILYKAQLCLSPQRVLKMFQRHSKVQGLIVEIGAGQSNYDDCLVVRLRNHLTVA